MAQIIKRPFKSFNGVDWDEHYFKTSADQVFMENGKTVEAGKVSTDVIEYKPIFNSGWENLSNVLSSYEPLKIWKDEFNIVHIQGGIKPSSSNSTNRIVLTLPVGFRPKGEIYQNAVGVQADSTWGVGHLYSWVGATGELGVYGLSPLNTVILNIEFKL